MASVCQLVIITPFRHLIHGIQHENNVPLRTSNGWIHCWRVYMNILEKYGKVALFDQVIDAVYAPMIANGCPPGSSSPARCVSNLWMQESQVFKKTTEQVTGWHKNQRSHSNKIQFKICWQKVFFFRQQYLKGNLAWLEIHRISGSFNRQTSQTFQPGNR